MIRFHRALVAFLRADATLAALVEDRVFPLFSRQGDARNMVVYRQAGSSVSRSLSGPRNRDATVELTAWATDYEAAYEIQEAVERALDGFTGTWTTTAPGGAPATVSVRKCHVGSVTDQAGEDGMCGVATEFAISYQVT